MSWAWAETRPAGDVNKAWVQTAISADGKTILAASTTGLYLTTDGGVNWVEKTPSGVSGQSWSCIAVSGSYLLAGASFGRLWESIDKGATWTELRPCGNVDKLWRACAVSSDGTCITVAVYASNSYVSNDGGISWIEWSFSWGKASYTSCAMSADGRYQLICWKSRGPYVGEVGQVWRSTDYGTTWRKCVFPITSDGDFSSVDVSLQGDSMIATSYNYLFGSGARVLVSYDFGGTWSKANLVTAQWRGGSCSYHGIHMLVCCVPYNLSPGRLWGTHDGRNWNEEQPIGNVNAAWIFTSMSALGDKVVAAIYNGRMWIGTLPTQPTPSFNSCYWDINTSKQTTSAGTAEGKTTEQMETQSTFVNWDFSKVWNIVNEAYPFLRSAGVIVTGGCVSVVHYFPWFRKFNRIHM